MRTKLKVPTLGGEAKDVIIVQWLAAVGDVVEIEQPIVSVEVDKIDVEIPSPVNGVLIEITAELGARLAPGDPLCIIDS